MAISDDTRKHIEAERKESILMVSKLARTLGKVENAGVVLAKAFEWPRGASGWAQRQVKDLAKSMPFKCIFDGCWRSPCRSSASSMDAGTIVVGEQVG